MPKAVRVEGRRIAPIRALPVVIRTVLCGSEQLAWNGRQVRVDVDAYLAVNGDDPVLLSWRSSADSRPLVLHYSALDVARALDRQRRIEPGETMPLPATFGFAECLRSIDEPAGRLLRAIGARAEDPGEPADDGQRDEILMQAVAGELAFRRRTGHVAAKATTRDQLVRRILEAGDFILSNHEQPLSITEMARIAGLSAYYFSRLFVQVYGVPPHAFLREKRARVARRLLAFSAPKTGASAAAEVGYGSRASLYRMLQRGRPP